jgi:hypothetical protein
MRAQRALRIVALEEVSVGFHSGNPAFFGLDPVRLRLALNPVY